MKLPVVFVAAQLLASSAFGASDPLRPPVGNVGSIVAHTYPWDDSIFPSGLGRPVSGRVPIKISGAKLKFVDRRIFLMPANPYTREIVWTWRNRMWIDVDERMRDHLVEAEVGPDGSFSFASPPAGPVFVFMPAQVPGPGRRIDFRWTLLFATVPAGAPDSIRFTALF